MEIACTIIAKNYVAYARTLCASFLRHHPAGRCFVLIIDDWEGFIEPAQEQFEIVSISDLTLPQPWLHFAFKYDITELSTAVKPFLLEYLLNKYAFQSLLYLDPDILVTAPLAGLYERLRPDSSADFILTPHLDHDFPDDGLRPGDDHILTSGVFNLGFFGLRAGDNATAFLRWWQHKLTNHCLIAHRQGYFVDQRFLDLAITLFAGFFIEKDVGYNAAYWNLHSRHFHQDENQRWFCNDGPLYFYHFSNYKLQVPGVLSGFLSRYSLQDRPDLQPLFADYRQQLLSRGYAQTSGWPYTYGTFRDGRAIPHPIRALYRRISDSRGQPAEPDPFGSARLSRLAALVNVSLGANKKLRGALGFRIRKLRRKFGNF